MAALTASPSKNAWTTSTVRRPLATSTLRMWAWWTPSARTAAPGAAVLADGVHHAHIRKVDVANGRLTVDVVQAFFDGDAVKAAIADGRSREEAQYLPVWLRNENPRLRTQIG